MKKGFTLIELLGVIIILALIMVFTLPSIINAIKTSSNQKNDINLKLIYNATDIYIDKSKDEFVKENGNVYCITLRELVNSGYLKSPIVLYNNEDLTDIKSVEVTYQDGFIYEIQDNESCVESN